MAIKGSVKEDLLKPVLGCHHYFSKDKDGVRRCEYCGEPG